MKRFDLYGSRTMSVEAVVRSLEVTLSADFAEHESGYRGLYFRLAGKGEELLVQANVADHEGYLPEPDFAPWRTLVYVNGSDRWATLEHGLAEVGLNPLRSELI